jgi:hypothetical protein
MFISAKHCRSIQTLSSIAEIFGVKISGLNMSNTKFLKGLSVDIEMQKIIAQIEERINDKSIKM